MPQSANQSEGPLGDATTVTIRQFADLPRSSGGYFPAAIASGPHDSLWVTDVVDQDFGGIDKTARATP
jgi:hypothetical protein